MAREKFPVARCTTFFADEQFSGFKTGALFMRVVKIKITSNTMAGLARFKELLDKVAEGDASPLDDGQLFRSIRGIQTKLDMVANAVAMVSLTQ